MALTIEGINQLRDYLNGVLGRAGHHAGNVSTISLTLAGAVVWKADGSVKVMERDGETKNVLWFNVRDRRYVLTYNHEPQCIDLKADSTQGGVLTSFDNSTQAIDVYNFFGSL